MRPLCCTWAFEGAMVCAAAYALVTVCTPWKSSAVRAPGWQQSFLVMHSFLNKSTAEECVRNHIPTNKCAEKVMRRSFRKNSQAGIVFDVHLAQETVANTAVTEQVFLELFSDLAAKPSFV